MYVYIYIYVNIHMYIYIYIYIYMYIYHNASIIGKVGERESERVRQCESSE